MSVFGRHCLSIQVITTIVKVEVWMLGLVIAKTTDWLKQPNIVCRKEGVLLTGAVRLFDENKLWVYRTGVKGV